MWEILHRELLLDKFNDINVLPYFNDCSLRSACTKIVIIDVLLQTKDNLFSSIPIDNNAQQIIEQAIDDLGEYTSHAQYDERISLSVVRDFLLNHFNQPEPGRQFMAGQVTF